ncbi:hypothetical protein QUF90_23355 [Desulfococcaceae bacterium HSG9]|nr:hypothetical protein [Desulfococcaceae bacterium HSG9]
MKIKALGMIAHGELTSRSILEEQERRHVSEYEFSETACPHRNMSSIYGTQRTRGIRILQICRSYGAENRRAFVAFQKLFDLLIIHVVEKLWKIGRACYGEGSEETEKQVEKMKSPLYKGLVKELLSQLKEMLKQLSKRSERNKSRRVILSAVIKYMEHRSDMMNYKEYIEVDLLTASGIAKDAAWQEIGVRDTVKGKLKLSVHISRVRVWDAKEEHARQLFPVITGKYRFAAFPPSRRLCMLPVL